MHDRCLDSVASGPGLHDCSWVSQASPQEWWLGCPDEGFWGSDRTTLLAGHAQRCLARGVGATFSHGPHLGMARYVVGTNVTDFPGDLVSPILKLLLSFGALSLSPEAAGLRRDVDSPGPRIVSVDMPAGAFEPAQPPATDSIRELLRWTGGSAELLAELLGASRRSIYNWIKGKPVRGQFVARTVRLRAALAPLGEEWHPHALSQWLDSGSPNPVELARDERWADLEERVSLALRPLRPREEAAKAAHGDMAESLSRDAILAVLDEFGSPPPITATVQTDWRPRELTGTSPGADEE